MDILILHGWGLCGEKYQPLIKLLERKNHRVFAPDFPGFGSENVQKTPYTLDDYVAFIRAQVQENKIINPLMIGHSFGGRVAIVYASKYKKDISSLVLTGVPGYASAPRGKIQAFRAIAISGNVILSLPFIRNLKPLARRILYKAARVSNYQKTTGNLRQTFINVISYDLVKPMKDITARTTLIWGKDDKTTPVWIGEKMQKTIENSALIVFGGGHCLIYDDPHSFIQALENVI